MPRTNSTQRVIDAVFNSIDQFSDIIQLDIVASRERVSFKRKLIENGFHQDFFYLNPGDEMRHSTLLYSFLYGIEKKVTATGLKEEQLRYIFTHESFERIIKWMLPEINKNDPWVLSNERNLKKFCNELFIANLKYYKEAVPIRLASYFHPEFFFPLFIISRLVEQASLFGFISNSNSKENIFYEGHRFLNRELSSLNVSNVVKIYLIDQVAIALDLRSRLHNQEPYGEILSSYKKKWEKDHVERGHFILTKNNLL